MKLLLVSFLLHFFTCATQGRDKFAHTLDHIVPQSSPEEQANAVQSLINRIIPERNSSFSIKVNTELKIDGKEVFQILKTPDGRIEITATTGVVAATGLNYYLKYFCNCHISWETSQLNLPPELPDVDIVIIMNDRFRYYQNVCTTSYSFVWWDWNQWEKHIDWMVLNSFNLVLAFNGQEAIWQRVYEKFNLTQEEIDEHFSGPAFLSWVRMGNMRGFGGPLSKSWHNRSLFFQKMILTRMRSFGIIPVLPAFAGHLPRGFKRLYPDAKMVEVGEWNGFQTQFCCPYFLDPTEQLFNQIAKTFMEEQIAEFGTDHVYNCDSFNENTPSTGDLVYLNNVGKSIYKAMTDIDDQAVWLMQGWLFLYDIIFWTADRAEALLTSVPIGKMIILDLQSEQWPQYERMDQYFGQPYIWCMLHNFGGTLGMFGSSEIINERVIEARNAINSTMIGTGVTPEGINQNYVIYDLMIESAWRNKSSNLTQWFDNYTVRRYGLDDENAKAAWRILQKTIYNFSDLIKMRGKYTINRSPSLSISVWSWYSEDDLFNAWQLLLKSSDKFKNSNGYLHDLVDITRQILQVKGDTIYQDMLKAFSQKNLTSFQSSADRYLSIFPDLNEILSTSPAFLLGKWLESAKAAANDSLEEQLFEYNARNQITLWGPNGEIMDYANKQWAGIASDFFHPRWKMFIEYMNETLITNTTFNQSFIRNKILEEVEKPFTLDRSVFPDVPLGETIEVAKNIYDKWKTTF